MTADPQSWWKRTTVYEVVVRSFADDNGDGIGDMPGLIGKLDYLQWLGVETIWLTPIYPSPLLDFGYDVSDYRGVAPEYGTIDDLSRLIEALHARGMKLVLDLVLNHTSSEHPWFVDALKGPDARYRDFYIWRKGRKPHGGAPPNNWKSVLGESGWHWDERSDEWYWASFTQPDVNWRNPELKREMLDLVRSWLRAGVDGFRLDMFFAYWKGADFLDNPPSHRLIPRAYDPDGLFQQAKYTANLPETFAFARELRSVIDEFSSPPRFVVGELFSGSEQITRYCGGADGGGLNLAFDFEALEMPIDARGCRRIIEELERTFPAPLWPTCTFGNHDRVRVMTRLHDDPARAKLLAAFQLTVRGVPFLYYGEELGLTHPPAQSLRLSRDPIAQRFRFVPRFVSTIARRVNLLLNREEVRGPMPWEPGPSAGFSPAGAKPPWLPLHPDAQTTNVALEKSDATSVLSSYRRMLALRKRCPALSGGRLELLDLPEPLLAYWRIDGDSRAFVALNFSSQHHTIDLPTGAQLWSSLHDAPSTPTARHTLAPWECVVVVSSALELA